MQQKELKTTSSAFTPEILQFLREKGMGAELKQLEKDLGVNLDSILNALSKFITQDPHCSKVKEQARTLTVHDDSVLIQGETGTGKEIIAQVLGSNRFRGNFVAINVSAIPSDLIESTLFGYVKGSFTGATIDRQGLIQFAGEGTLFLDEIGDLPLNVQSKFLRVIQDKKVRRIGSNEEEDVKCRFIAASHMDLKSLVATNKFRLDLYARLSTFILRIPPLRARLADIPLILATLCPDFPADKINWVNVDLSLNVRSLEQIARRYTVFGELPEELVG